MRSASGLLEQSVPGAIRWTFEADVLYGSELLVSTPLASLDLTWDASGYVECSGSASIVRGSVRGESWVPQGPGDMLAPYGSELAVYARPLLGGLLDERVQLARLRIAKLPASVQSRAVVGSESVVVAERIELDVRDRMVSVMRDRFTTPQSPPNGAGAYAELTRLTGFVVRRSVPDVSLRSTILYDEEREKAVERVGEALGGDVHFDSYGDVRVRPTLPGAPVARFETGQHGVIEPLSSEMDSEGVYNGVVVTGKSAADESEIRVERWIQSGPLAPTSPMGRVATAYHSDMLTTYALVAAEADRRLRLLQAPRARRVATSLIPHPLLEVGDVVEVVDPSGRVDQVWLSKISWSGELMQVEGVVL